jgi:hypothetical protein
MIKMPNGLRTEPIGMIEQLSRVRDIDPHAEFIMRLQYNTNSVVLSVEEATRLRDSLTALLSAPAQDDLTFTPRPKIHQPSLTPDHE